MAIEINGTFPHANVRIADMSSKTKVTETESDLHVALCFGLAEKGVANKLFYSTGPAAHISEFGTKTFNDPSSNYFTHQSVFARMAINKASYFVRVIPDELENTSVANSIIGVKYDSSTKTVYVASGASSKTGMSNTATGVVLGNGFTTMLMVNAKSVGAYYNQLGFRLLNLNKNDTNQVKTPLWRFTPIYLESGVAGNPTIIRDIYGNSGIQVWMDNNVSGNVTVDRKLKTVLNNSYLPNTPNSTIEFNVTFGLSSTLNSIKSSMVATLDNPNVDANTVDILTATYFDPILNQRTEFNDIKVVVKTGLLFESDDSTQLDTSKWDTSVNGFRNLENGVYLTSYRLDTNTSELLKNPPDPLIQNVPFEALVKKFISDNENQLSDFARYPFTHAYDSGFKDKEAMLGIYNYRDGFDIAQSTRVSPLVTEADGGTSDYQDPSETDGLEYDDISVATTIVANFNLLGNECDIFNTPAMRSSVYGQMGYLSTSDSGYVGWCPMTLKLLELRTKYHSGTYITGDFGPYPNNVVDIFTKVDYTLSTALTKQNAWDKFLNLCSYGDRNTLYYPAFRSVYPVDNSILSSTEYVDYVIYVTKICRRVWSRLVGSRQPTKDLFSTVNKTIEKEVAKALNNRLTCEANTYQTVTDETNGYSVTTDVKLYGDPIFRSANFNIVTYRSSDYAENKDLANMES